MEAPNASTVGDSGVPLLDRISILKMKIKGRLRLSRGAEITPSIFSEFRREIREYITEMDICICKRQISCTSEEEREHIESDWLDFRMAVHKELEDLSSSLLPSETADYSDQPSSLYLPETTHSKSPSSFTVKLPQVQITGPIFNGREMEDDRMSFRNFLSRFENCVAGMVNDAEKLNFLKCSLSERPLLLINHLSCINENYQQALAILKKEYLDVEDIIDKIFQDIIDYNPQEQNLYVDLGNFISKTASILEELAHSLFCDFSGDDSAGARLMAKILFLKYPRELKGELILLCGSRIPTLSALLQNTGEAIKRLLIKSGGVAGPSLSTDRAPPRETFPKSRGASTRRDASFQVVSDFKVPSGYYGSLPPVICVTFGRGGRTASVNCLLDTGSGRTYLAGDILHSLGSLESVGLDCHLKLTTLLGECERKFREVMLDVDVGSGFIQQSPVLVADTLDLSLRLRNWNLLFEEFRRTGCSLAGRFDSDTDLVSIRGIMGLDLVQHLGPLQLVPCLRGWAFSVPAGLIPFGEVSSFFSTDHSSAPVTSYLLFDSIMEQTPQVESTHVCFVLESDPSYVDPLVDFFPFSEVERGLEQMFSIESLGIQSGEISSYDRDQIQRFQKSIKFKDGNYHVQLPWHTDKLAQVPSNHSIALRVLDRVVKSLEKKGLYQEYLEVFFQQEQEGIIEEIHVTPQNFEDYIWMPHRPIFKSDPAATTKIRPVFNCSLKAGGSASLNEAAYSGVNLTANMLDLIMSFRSNKYVLLADIRKAFLMIRLSLEADRNRFCFFVKDGDRLRCFRYSTLIFGFTSSPFILGSILRYHAAQYPQDECRAVMEDRFYVDNLIVTESDPVKLAGLYTLTRKRLQEGGFVVQSCNSNCNRLREEMKTDGTLSSRDGGWEMVLGYRYDPQLEKLRIAPIRCDAAASTKRQILSESAKVFDPLSLCLPVTIRSRVLVGELWKRALDWDDRVPPELHSAWKNLAADLSGLSEVHFNRQARDGGRSGDLYLFCDASREAYGFAAYFVQDQQSALIFAKARVAPLKEKTLPTLELMAVFLALKCLPTILDSCKGVTPSRLYVATDAQVVLSWILSKTMASKCIFARNRLRDIMQMSLSLDNKYGIKPTFKYVSTTQNPADMITRGLTLKKFRSNLEFWYRGPSWLRDGVLPWPTQNLPCLDDRCQQIARSAANFAMVRTEECPSVVSWQRFSAFTRLLRVTSLVFRFIGLTRGRQEDYDRKAALYLVKTSQQQQFPEELGYLRDPIGRSTPHRVIALDLFLDQEGLIRSGGRIDRSSHFSNEVKNPLLLGKNHHLTRLIILDCHNRCSHLGVGSTLAELRRSGYWVPQGRQAVKSALTSCTQCKKYNSRPVLPENLAGLQTPRVEFEVPYRNTGVDFTGHFWVKERNTEKKMYLLLFTCLSVRAVHIEVVPDMSILSFFQALVRFTNVHGVPESIHCDNAKTFLGSGRLFSRLSLLQEYQNKFGSCNIRLKTIPQFSPWFGGAWERNIKTLKSCLYKIIGRGKVDYFTLLTIISDIQRAVNNRPLTYQESSERQLKVITPNMFLRPNKSPGLLLQTRRDDLSALVPPSRKKLIKSLELRNQWLSRFRELWYNEYLLDLRGRSSGRSRVPFQNRIKKNDVVLVKSPLKPRPFWMLGTIIDVFPGGDGVVRTARVKQGDGLVKVHSLRHLYPMEIAQSSDEPVEVETDDPAPSGSVASGNSGDSEPTSSSRERDSVIWLCPACNTPQGSQRMICCDSCDEWYHFECVGIEVPPPARQKWYCADCAPRKKRRGRPSLLPA